MTIPDFNNLMQRTDFEAIFSKVVMDNSAEMIDALTNQMQHGISGNGDKIGEYQSQEYADMKFQMNSDAGSGFVDLKLTGDFYNGMALSQIDTDFQIDSSDEKDVDLQNKYGAAIMSFSEDTAGEVAQGYLLPEFLKDIREVLFL